MRADLFGCVLCIGAFAADDLADDFSDLQTEEFGFGFDDDADPNIKPRVAEPPREKITERGMTSVSFEFPAQLQVISSLEVHCIPASNVKSRSMPFASYSGDFKKGEMKIVIDHDPAHTTAVTVRNLLPDTGIQRLIR